MKGRGNLAPTEPAAADNPSGATASGYDAPPAARQALLAGLTEPAQSRLIPGAAARLLQSLAAGSLDGSSVREPLLRGRPARHPGLGGGARRRGFSDAPTAKQAAWQEGRGTERRSLQQSRIMRRERRRTSRRESQEGAWSDGREGPQGQAPSEPVADVPSGKAGRSDRPDRGRIGAMGARRPTPPAPAPRGPEARPARRARATAARPPAGPPGRGQRRGTRVSGQDGRGSQAARQSGGGRREDPSNRYCGCGGKGRPGTTRRRGPLPGHQAGASAGARGSAAKPAEVARPPGGAEGQGEKTPPTGTAVVEREGAQARPGGGAPGRGTRQRPAQGREGQRPRRPR